VLDQQLKVLETWSAILPASTPTELAQTPIWFLGLQNKFPSFKRPGLMLKTR